MQFTADDAARQLVEMMSDPQVDARERVKIAQDLLDRAGLAAAQVHKVLPIEQDPIEKLFTDLLQDEQALLPEQPELDAPAADQPLLPAEIEQPTSREVEDPCPAPPANAGAGRASAEPHSAAHPGSAGHSLTRPGAEVCGFRH
ncbi:putative membrane protein [Aeromicrobium sp. SORGH_AS981]|uniref:hypothetical protein n=1 Tax=Aeromicrobium sp. SORGH_AS_0981 TaxID=3041802 RepID=UPI0028657ABE|nr:hypothetical protein [Aeromicrobium sp. SORGH_AS_0981]MDR6120292.1 putative membrane protein [Aeromicrobium sp. SORGH_AS_0981]